MNGSLTMEQFLGEVDRRDDAKKDLLVGPKSMMMEEDGEHLAIDNAGSYGIKETAHGQFASKLGIPKSYYDSTAQIAGLRAYNVNAWLSKDTDKHLVRTLDGNVRGLLSDRFKPVDNYLILASALPVLNEHPDLQVISSQLSDTRMYLQITFPRLQTEVTVGDVIQAGITLTNSEIGYGAVDVKSWVLRLRCKNGAVGESILRQYHTGKRLGSEAEDYDIYSNETIQSDLKTFGLKLRDVLKASVTQAKLEEMAAKFRVAAGDKITGSAAEIEKIVQNVTKKYNLSPGDSKDILANLWKAGDMSRWGIANAVTALVHDVKDADKQYDLEKTGYEIMTLPALSWKGLTATAA